MGAVYSLCCWRRPTPIPTPTPPNESLELVEIEQNNIVMTQPIIIDICLNTVIAEENRNITLHCALVKVPEDNVTVTWTKNGEVLQSSRRIKIEANGKDHKLIITCVAEQDQGIYCIMFKQRDIVLFSKGLLFVKPAYPNFNNGVIYLKTDSRHTKGVLLQLLNKKVYVGDDIELQAVFEHPKIQEYSWFKNGQPIKEDERISLFSDDRTANIYVRNAKVTDSGIYHVITKTRHGISSSFADVSVFNLDPEKVFDNKITPQIDKQLPREIEAYEGEDVRLITKISYDVNTDVSWKIHNLDNITFSIHNLESKKNIDIQFYNNEYVSLNLNCVSLSDTGLYSLIVRNVATDSSTTSYCNLSVKPLPMQTYLTKAKILVPLKSAVAYVGSSVVYRCKFEVENPEYCCALWEVGPYQVEHTSNKYCIFCNGTEFFLYIKKVEPDMAGIVSCRICKVIPRRKSYSVRTSTASLTIVPNVVTADIANGLPLADSETWFYDTLFTQYVKINNLESATVKKIETESKRTEVEEFKINLCGSKISTAISKTPIHRDGPSTSKSFDETGWTATETSENITMYITLARCNEAVYWIDITSNAPRAFEHVAVEETLQEVYNRTIREVKWETILKFEWKEIGNVWYALDIHVDNNFIGSGVTRIPIVMLNQIPYEIILGFRIRAVKPQGDHITPLNIFFEVNDSSTPKPRSALPMSAYPTLFSESDELLGYGAFGEIRLVQDTEGVSYAAKFIKTSSERKRIRAVREYELLSTLPHPNIVKADLAFQEEENFTIIMDYLWGGDLQQRLNREGHLKECDVIVYVRQICDALHYLHSRSIVHLDIKPPNIICVSPNSRRVKLADFGLARILEESNPVRAFYVTREFVPPELLNYQAISVACDMWSLGVVSYMLLSGITPFTGETIQDMIRSINIVQYKFDHPAFRNVSDHYKDFIRRIFLLYPEHRMTAEQALEHDWLKEPRGGVRSNFVFQTRDNGNSKVPASNKRRAALMDSPTMPGSENF